MHQAPNRGRIIIVNFEKGGAAVPPEMTKSQRPCVVVQNNKLARQGLVTVVPVSMTRPNVIERWHHRLDHRSFVDWPLDWDGQGAERWAKCDYVTTVSLQRCSDPYRKTRHGGRRYITVKAIAADIKAIESAILFALGIVPEAHSTKEQAASLESITIKDL